MTGLISNCLPFLMKCDVSAFPFSDHLTFDGPCHDALHHVFLHEQEEDNRGDWR
jgi:hypothetical protein